MGSGGDTDVFGVFGVESLGVDKEVLMEVNGRPDLLTVGGRGNANSVPSDDEEMETLAMSEPAKELVRCRRPPSSRLGLVSTAFKSFLESIPGLGWVLLVLPLSRFASAGIETFEPALCTLATLSLFLTGMTTPLPPSPKRENLGVGSVMDIQFSVGSREIEGGLDEAEVDWWIEETARSSSVTRWFPYFIVRLAVPASSRIALRAHRGMVGIGGAV